MIRTGFINKLKISGFTQHGAYLADGGEDEVLLPDRYLNDEMEADDELEVFVYRDSEDRQVATTETPLAMADQFACLEVVDVMSIGAFLNWGLSKDLLVPQKEMPEYRLRKGQKIVVRVYIDQVSDRVVASTRLGRFLDKDLDELSQDQKVSAMVYSNMDFGSLVILDERWGGLIHRNEFSKPPEIGSRHTAWLRRLTEEGVDATLAPVGYEGRDEAFGKIFEVFEKIGEDEGTFLPWHDKSDPEDIRQIFGMSKKSFKRLIGNMQRQGLLKIRSDGIFRKIP